jgi:Holliday junction resolvase RusA-like endonuclease
MAWAMNKFNDIKYTNVIKFELGEDIKDKISGYEYKPDDIYEVKVTFFRTIVDRVHFKTRERIKSGELIYSNTRPDLDNAVRPILNSLTGIIWKDDMHVVKLVLEKLWAEKEKTIIEIKVLA